MSYRHSSKRVPYCATCEKAGEPESVFRSHFTRNTPGGRVVCPTILKFFCKECGEVGHIANEKYCPVLRSAANEDRSWREARNRAESVLKLEKEKERKLAIMLEKEKADQLKRRIASNPFSVAFDSDSEDDDVSAVTAEPEPRIISNCSVMSYKDVLSKPLASSSTLAAPAGPHPNFMVINPSNFSRTFKRRSWADDSSSDEEND